jgi:ABC-type uncharacterized transport system auxiliary subunit
MPHRAMNHRNDSALRRPKASVFLALAPVLLAAACGSVKAPEVFEYRLAWPEPQAKAEDERGGCLRVGELQVAASLEGDRLRVATGKVRLQSFEHHRWAAPLDRMVADVLVAGLARTRSFASVLTAADDGREDYVLSGRVLELEQTADPATGEWVGVVTLELRLRDVSTGIVVFEDEFRCEQPLQGEGPEALVAALSGAVGTVVDDVVGRCDQEGVFSSLLERDQLARPGR